MMIDRARVAAAVPNYVLGEDLGAGAFGLVLRAEHRRMRRPSAIKVMRARDAGGEWIDFAAEARLLGSLDHPHVVRVYDYVEDDDLRLVVMELLGGGTLSRRRSRLTPEQACAVGLAVAAALSHTHDHNVLHRDVKGDNILFAADGTVKVVDFGIARVFEGAATTASKVVGTPMNMAPEQIERGRLGPATDLYALGSVLYRLLTGRPPFDPRQPLHVLWHQQLSAPPPPMPGVAGPVAEVVLHALAKDPAARPPDAVTFATALAHAATEAYGAGWTVRAGLPLHLDDAVRRAAEGTSLGGMRAPGAVIPDAVIPEAVIPAGDEPPAGSAVAIGGAVAAGDRARRESAADGADSDHGDDGGEDRGVGATRKLAQGGKPDLWDGAEPTAQGLARLRGALGPDHPDTLAAANSLAVRLSARGDHRAARALDEDTLARRGRVLGPDHPDTLTSAHNLAVDLAEVGDQAAARDLYREALARRRRVLGPDHPDTLGTANNLGIVLGALGDHLAACELGEDTLIRRRRVLGESHPDSLTSAYNLAVRLSALGDHEAACELGEDTFTRRVAVLGPGHPDTVRSAYNLAVYLGRLGRYPRAREIGADVLTSRLRALGPEHPETREVEEALQWWVDQEAAGG
ncbi:serine/threonine-protein kinase [Frankia sp. CcI49]|uniref:serine/threonine-protein kinase n=1 Tax=Frankia sp. CcI49 TaxID=1745382 RepID=UPI00097600B6|nr:serine/threonine-protein kinase [Frankia sp. CcI49]